MTLPAKNEKLLNDVYYNEYMLVGRDNLYHYLVSKTPDDHPTRNEVMSWLKAQKVYHTCPRSTATSD